MTKKNFSNLSQKQSLTDFKHKSGSYSKKHFTQIILISIFLILLLIFPGICRDGAKTGLLLWFNTMIPATFPFILTTNILNQMGGIKLFNKLFGKGISYIFKCSPNGAYAIITGLLCGYPIGAKTVSDSFSAGHISKDEAHYLLAFCSMPSPVYLMNYVLDASLKKSTLTLPYLASVYAGCWLNAMTFYLFYSRKKFIFSFHSSSDFHQHNADLFHYRKESHTHHQYNFKHTNYQPYNTCSASRNFNLSSQNPAQTHLQRHPKPQTTPASATNLNTSMMSSLTVIQKMGIYMILFSILATLIMQFPGQLVSLKILKVIGAGICEQTIGVFVTVTHIGNGLLSCLICMFLTSFGGIAVAMQAKSLANPQLDFSFYIKGKLLHAMYSSLILGILLIYFV